MRMMWIRCAEQQQRSQAAIVRRVQTNALLQPTLSEEALERCVPRRVWFYKVPN